MTRMQVPEGYELVETPLAVPGICAYGPFRTERRAHRRVRELNTGLPFGTARWEVVTAGRRHYAIAFQNILQPRGWRARLAQKARVALSGSGRVAVVDHYGQELYRGAVELEAGGLRPVDNPSRLVPWSAVREVEAA